MVSIILSVSSRSSRWNTWLSLTFTENQMKLSEIKESQPTIQLNFGAAGAGKTWYAASAPEPIIVTDLNGIVTLQSPGFRSVHPNLDMEVILVNADEEPTKAKAYDEVRTKIDNLFTNEKLKTFKTIIIDDIGHTRTAARNKAVVLNGLSSRSHTLSKMASGVFKEIPLPGIQDFGTEMLLTELFVQELTAACRQYNKNLIINSHERHQFKKVTDNQGRQEEILQKIRPMFTGKTAPNDITRYFDLVWYLETIGNGNNVKRQFITDAEGIYECKNRWAGLFKNPERDLTAGKVFERIRVYQETGKIIP